MLHSGQVKTFVWRRVTQDYQKLRATWNAFNSKTDENKHTIARLHYLCFLKALSHDSAHVWEWQ